MPRPPVIRSDSDPDNVAACTIGSAAPPQVGRVRQPWPRGVYSGCFSPSHCPGRDAMFGAQPEVSGAPRTFGSTDLAAVDGGYSRRKLNVKHSPLVGPKTEFSGHVFANVSAYTLLRTQGVHANSIVRRWNVSVDIACHAQHYGQAMQVQAAHRLGGRAAGHNRAEVRPQRCLRSHQKAADVGADSGGWDLYDNM